MRFQSKLDVSAGSYVPIGLDPGFPVSEPDFNERSSKPTIAPHVHDFLEIGYCYDGNGVFIIEDKILPFKKGDSVLINNRELHIMTANAGEMTRWGFLYLDPVALLSSYVTTEESFLEPDTLCGRGFNNITNCDIHPEICAMTRDIIEEVANRKPGYKSIVRSLTWNMMVRYHRMNAGRQTEPEVPGLKENLRRIMPAMEYIAGNFSRPIDMGKLIRLSCSSESNFRKLFHKAVGCAPHVYIKRLRMKTAAVLLRNSRRPILDIATSSGYVTLSNFNRQFLEFYGVSPREWRKNGHAPPTSTRISTSLPQRTCPIE